MKTTSCKKSVHHTQIIKKNTNNQIKPVAKVISERIYSIVSCNELANDEKVKK